MTDNQALFKVGDIVVAWESPHPLVSVGTKGVVSDVYKNAISYTIGVHFDGFPHPFVMDQSDIYFAPTEEP